MRALPALTLIVMPSSALAVMGGTGVGRADRRTEGNSEQLKALPFRNDSAFGSYRYLVTRDAGIQVVHVQG